MKVRDSERASERSRSGAAVSLHGVTRVFGLIPAIVRIDLAVQRGETLLIEGPNGAGKSTLLRVIATALSPSFGQGSVFGFDLVREREHVRRRIELLGHRSRLYEDLTASENLLFTCALYGLDPRAVNAVLERVGLSEVAKERVRGFSQGMRQRVVLGRALLRSPELLLLDEPYAGLDSDGKQLVDESVLAAQRAGHTVLLATHDRTRAKLASRRLSMLDGRLSPRPVASLIQAQPR